MFGQFEIPIYLRFYLLRQIEFWRRSLQYGKQEIKKESQQNIPCGIHKIFLCTDDHELRNRMSVFPNNFCRRAKACNTTHLRIMFSGRSFRQIQSNCNCSFVSLAVQDIIYDHIKNSCSAIVRTNAILMICHRMLYLKIGRRKASRIFTIGDNSVIGLHELPFLRDFFSKREYFSTASIQTKF